MKVLDNKEDFIMKLKDTGLTLQDIKDKVNKYMIETYERFDFLAETAEGMYIYDENGTPYLDFYAGIAVNNAGNRNPKVVAASIAALVFSSILKFNCPAKRTARSIRSASSSNRSAGLPTQRMIRSVKS